MLLSFIVGLALWVGLNVAVVIVLAVIFRRDLSRAYRRPARRAFSPSANSSSVA